MAVAAFRDQPRANLFQLAVAGLVIGIAFFLVDRPALRLTPEGAPGAQLALRANFFIEVRKQQGVELRRGEGAAPAIASFQFSRYSAAR